MEFSLTHKKGIKIECDTLVIGKFADKGFTGDLKSVDKELNGAVKDAVVAEKFEGKEGKTLLLNTLGQIKPTRVLIVGLGKSSDFDTNSIRKSAILAASKVKGFSVTVCFSLGIKHEKGFNKALIDGVILGNYKFAKYKSNNDKENGIETVLIRTDKSAAVDFEDELNDARSISEAINFTRDLINEPPAYLTPTKLASYAEEIAEEGGLKIQIFDKEEMFRRGMNGILAVNKGSDEPPKFIHLTYEPAKKASKSIAIVGKGVTFDSGGLSLKTAESMRTMKMDMGGAGVVLGVMRAISQLKPGHRVHGIIPSTENMTGGSAYKVDDVICALNGKTIEVINTDAEGRIILSDALSYAAELKVDEIIDLATLTGACIVALGSYTAGLMGNNASVIERVKKAAETSGEKVWELPMDEELRPQIQSSIADIKNAGSRWGGAITAAMFLENFVSDTPWAHIDIAGPAYIEKGGTYYPKGATGFGVRTVVSYILNR